MRLDPRYADYGALFIRVAFGARLIYGTQDNVLDWDKMREFSVFLDAHGFPLPMASAVTSVVLQFACGVLWILGWQTRWAALFMIVNFTVALIGVHIGDAYLSLAPALHLLVVAVFLLLHGAGRPSLDAWIAARRAAPSRG